MCRTLWLETALIRDPVLASSCSSKASWEVKNQRPAASCACYALVGNLLTKTLLSKPTRTYYIGCCCKDVPPYACPLAKNWNFQTRSRDSQTLTKPQRLYAIMQLYHKMIRISISPNTPSFPRLARFLRSMEEAKLRPGFGHQAIAQHLP